MEHREERWTSGIDDDRLRLIFTCCHPVLDPDSRIALTLRSVAWLSTDEIAAAFGTPVATMAQRLVRAKARIKSAGLPYRVPAGAELHRPAGGGAARGLPRLQRGVPVGQAGDPDSRRSRRRGNPARRASWPS